MKITRRSLRTRVAPCRGLALVKMSIVAAVIAFAGSSAHAANWDGGGNNSDWNNCVNWYSDTCSGTGSSEDINFNFQNVQWDSNYNYGDGNSFHNISFNSTLTHPMTLSNSSIGMSIYGDIFQETTNTVTWYPKIYFSGDRNYTIQADSGNLDIAPSGGTSIFLNANNRNLYFQGGSGKFIYVNAVIANGGGFSGNGIVVNSSGLTVLLKASNTYDGTTRINFGTLQLNADERISDSSALYVDTSGTFDKNGKTETVASIEGSGSILLGSTGGLIYGGNASKTFSGVISGSGTASVTKNGSGNWQLTGANTYTGATTINAGTLSLDNAGTTTARLANTSGITVNLGGTLLLASSSGSSTDRINNSATMTLNGGTFNTGGLSEHGASNNTAGIGALTLQNTSTIDMGNGASIIAFANSAATAATWVGHTLNIYDWTGTPITGGGTDQLYFGSDVTGLTAAQLADVQFFSGAGTGAYTAGAIILADGEIVPVPEPSTWAASALALAVIGYQFSVVRRRKAHLK
jgi:autotransporter-associated beta strand protein